VEGALRVCHACGADVPAGASLKGRGRFILPGSLAAASLATVCVCTIIGLFPPSTPSPAAPSPAPSALRLELRYRVRRHRRTRGLHCLPLREGVVTKAGCAR
jgi:hypothetical protein